MARSKSASSPWSDEMLDRLVDEQGRLLARPFLAEQRHERRLAGVRVLAGALARRGLVPAMVDEVVGDLEREADVARIAAIGRPRLGRQLGHDARRLDRIFDQRAGLQLLEPGDRRKVELLALRGEVHHLSAGHARRAGRSGQLEHEVGADPRVLVRRGMGEDLERQSVEAVAGEHRLGLAERLVNGRLAASQVGIVHARQIVVDQRIDMDRLDRAADAKRPLAVDREQSRRRNGEQRPKALAAADRGMAHRLVQPVAAVAGRRQQAGEEIVDLGARRGRLRPRARCQPVDGINRHRTV